MKELKIFKIGGNVIDNPEALEAFLREFAEVEGPKILVHGGGKLATRLCADLGIETRMIDGRRVTDRASLDVTVMVYAGLINKQVVAGLQSAGCDALGLTGADASTISATRRPARPVDYGFVGDFDTESVNAPRIRQLLRMGLTPVFCAIMADRAGGLLNCNADSVATALALGMARELGAEMPVSLVFCFEKAGVMRDIDDPDSVIAEITPESYPAMREEGIVIAGMIPKVEGALKAVKEGVGSVIIRSSKEINRPSGTKIRL